VLKDWIKEKAIWLAFAILSAIIIAVSSLVWGYVTHRLKVAENTVHDLKAVVKEQAQQNEKDKVQWRKISENTKRQNDSFVKQAYINGNIEGRLQWLEKR